MKQKTTFLTSGNTYLNQVILALMLIISTASFSQVAPVLFPNGGFNIDGNLDSDTSVGDWLGTRPNSFVFDIYPAFPFGDALRASPVTAVSTFRVIDAYDGNDDIFQGGGKYTDDPSTWKVNPNAKSGGKGDINNVLLHVGQDNTGDQWVIVASDRLVTTGTSYLDFEFLQKPLTYNNTTTGFITHGLDGGRTVGDILISVSYTNGGSVATVRYYEWEVDATSALGFNYIENTSVLPTRFGASNVGTVSTNIGAFGVGQYTANQFVEAAINISAFFETGDPCDGLTIGTILVKTKSSDAPTAALDDVVAPIPVRLNLGTAEIDYADADFCSPSASVSLLGVEGGTFSASPSGLSIDSLTGEIDLDSSTPGTYTVTYSFTTGTCPKSVTTSVVIPETSPIPNTINENFCKNAGVKNYNVTATPGYTLNYYATNNSADSPLTTVPVLDTDSAPIGLYTVYVSQNKTGSCESDRVPVTIEITSALVVSESITNVACLGESNGAIDLSVSGGSGAYVFEWKDSSNIVIATTEDLSGLAAGAYTVTIDSDSDCSFTDTYTITEPVAVTVSAESTNVSCNGAADGTITVSGLSAGATYTITLDGGDGTDLSGNTTFAPGTYTITASAANGNNAGTCEATASVTITEPVAVTVSAESTNVSCNGAADGTITVSASAGAVITVNGNPYDASATYTPGVYTIRAEAANGNDNGVCSDEIIITITQPDLVLPPVSGGDQEVCEDGSDAQALTATATVETGFSIVWYDATGSEVAVPELVGVGTVTYYAESVNDETGCVSLDRTAVSLTINAAPDAPVSEGDQEVCESGPIEALTAVATVADGFSIVWYTASEGGEVVENPILADVGSVTYYAEAVNDNTGCVSLSRTPVNLSICNNSQISLIKTSVLGDENGDGFAQAGETIVYTFTLTNSGNTLVTNISIDDAKLSLDNLVINPSTLAPGESGIATATYTITQGDIDAKRVINTALATGTDPFNNEVTDVSDNGDETVDDDGNGDPTDDPTDTDLPALSSLSAEKSVTFTDENGNLATDAGETLVYTFTVTNTGNTTLYDILIEDPLVEVIGGPIDLAPGATDSSTFMAVYTITAENIANQQIVNQAVVSASTAAGDLVEDLTDDPDNPNDVDANGDGDPDDPTVYQVVGVLAEEDIVIYNFVTPNDDGFNDYFQIENIENFPNKVQVFNKWGVQVFETTNYNPDTGNVFKGYSDARATLNRSAQLPTGTYYYIINYEREPGQMRNVGGYLYIN